MQSKSFYTLGLLIFFWLNQLYSQSFNDSIGTDKQLIDRNQKFINTNVNDTLNKKEPTLLDKVKYNASDYVRINRKESKLILYNEAELYYQDMELRAGIIVLDYMEEMLLHSQLPKPLLQL